MPQPDSGPAPYPTSAPYPAGGPTPYPGGGVGVAPSYPSPHQGMHFIWL